MKRSSYSRRDFLGTAAALSTPYLIPSRRAGRTGQARGRRRLTVAVIGVGGMGTAHLGNMLQFRKEGKVHIAAVCDCDEDRLAAAVKTAGPGVEPYRDYRYILRAQGHRRRAHRHARPLARRADGPRLRVAASTSTSRSPPRVTVEEGKAMVAAARDEQPRRPGRAPRPHRPRAPGTPAARSATGSSARSARSPAGTMPIPVDDEPGARLAPRRTGWIGTCGSARCRWRPYNRPLPARRRSAGSWNRAAGRSATAGPTSSAPSSGA